MALAWSPFPCFQPIPMEDQTTLPSYIGTGQTLPHDFLPTAKSETILFSRSGRKKKPPSRMTFSCCEIRNNDIFKAGLTVLTIMQAFRDHKKKQLKIAARNECLYRTTLYWPYRMRYDDGKLNLCLLRFMTIIESHCKPLETHRHTIADPRYPFVNLLISMVYLYKTISVL